MHCELGIYACRACLKHQKHHQRKIDGRLIGLHVDIFSSLTLKQRVAYTTAHRVHTVKIYIYCMIVKKRPLTGLQGHVIIFQVNTLHKALSYQTASTDKHYKEKVLGLSHFYYSFCTFYSWHMSSSSINVLQRVSCVLCWRTVYLY